MSVTAHEYNGVKVIISDMASSPNFIIEASVTITAESIQQAYCRGQRALYAVADRLSKTAIVDKSELIKRDGDSYEIHYF